MSQSSQAKALKALSQFVFADLTLHETLQRVSDITVEAIPACEMVGITMRGTKGAPATPVYTDDRSPRIDESQYESDKGPCLDAWRENKIIRIDDTRRGTDAYPEFCEAAAAAGISSTLSVPLAAGDDAIGALNLYSLDLDGFSSEDEETAVELSATAAVVLSNASAYWTAYSLSEHLNEAMKSRAVIEQAKGILMATSHVNADGAFEMLRTASQRENLKLREIAERIVLQHSGMNRTSKPQS